MTAQNFRTLAVSMPGAVEVGHMRHPDYRVDASRRLAIAQAWVLKMSARDSRSTPAKPAIDAVALRTT